MNLTELKKKTMPQLLEIAESMNLENLARSRKQDVIFSILKAHAKSGEDIYGDGVLEILSDGFGFLRCQTTGAYNLIQSIDWHMLHIKRIVSFGK